MVKVIWSDHALDDIEQISEYISKDSPERASLFVSRLIDAAEQMASFPNSGTRTGKQSMALIELYKK